MSSAHDDPRHPSHVELTAAQTAAGFYPTLAQDGPAADTIQATPSALDGDADRERSAPEDRIRGPLGDVRYDLLGVIGEGAMGTVHLARDHALRRRVALKTLSVDGPSLDLIERFLTEAQITAQLDHPHIVPVYALEVGPGGKPAYTMKLVEGETLEEIIEAAAARLGGDTREALVERLEAFIKVCDAMAYAHEKGVIHRDLKPANIMVGRFHEVYVMDWGIARLVDAPPEVGVAGSAPPPGASAVETRPGLARTRYGSILGTPLYMAPEQAAGKLDELTARTDVCTLGLVLYEVSHLALPYSGPTITDVVSLALGGDRREPPDTSIAPAELRAIIARAAARDPADRYPSASAFAADLRRLLRGEETEALPDDAWRRLRRWMGRHLKATVTVVLTLLLFSAALVVWSQLRERARLAEMQLESQVRSQAVADVVNGVGARAQRIANHFQFYEGLVEGLAQAASYALSGDRRWEGPIHRAEEFASDATAPASAGYSLHYARFVSPDDAAYLTPRRDGPRGDALEAEVRRLYTLKSQVQSMFLIGPNSAARPATEEDRRLNVMVHEVPIEWVHVTTASGVSYVFPGAAAERRRDDPRDDPWYFAAEDAWKSGSRDRRRWSAPYRDVMGGGRVLTCAQAIVAASGDVLGVAALDLSFEFVSDHYMTLSDVPGFVASFLLDEEGDIMVETGDGAIKADAEKLDFGRFDAPEVLAGVREERSGHALVESWRGAPRLLVWARLELMGWTYVAALDPAALEAATMGRLRDEEAAEP